ncbi:hypothetical protein CON65_03695 [Bacillus pseudomycoides]|uniref:Uncharacterized protein n=1 Tax=Bacillus pseudomycoides TaxID=64104 RepID=A0AA91VGV0_9BACI|nr:MULTISPECIES: hypothetical protein [Bacillus]PEB54329.1 hypothetical protein COO03_05585 [Bacillus sp. AFS098217]PED83990.1 hypothetical protein CON65_03695 [Bacillus pseudomycoides]PEU06637.1 hypothetical protein CN524_22925 [Bacillus sp. AFS019443]
MKKGVIGLFIAAIFLIFTGGSADMKEVEKATGDKLKDSQLGPYIEEVSYKAGEKKDEDTPVSVQIKVNEKFSDLPNMDKYATMDNAFEKIIDSYNQISCGGNNKCRYQDLQVFYDDDTYVMDLLNKALLINDFETYTKGDYIVDVDREQEKEKTKSANNTYKINSNNTPKSTTQNNEQFSSNGINYKSIFTFMREQYNILTNNNENYIPEVHDPQVAEKAAKRFGISAEEAGYIYEKVQMDAFR